jgi:hypothetical protein
VERQCHELLMRWSARECKRGKSRMTNELRYPTADRWAVAIVTVVRSDNDPRTLDLWARAAATSRGTLRGWCYAARAAPRASLDFARLLRVVCRAPLAISDPLMLLDIVDPRTTTRLLRRAGFSLHQLSCAVGCPSQFLRRQCLVSDPTLLAAVCDALRLSRSASTRSSGAHQCSHSAPPAAASDAGLGSGPIDARNASVGSSKGIRHK